MPETPKTNARSKRAAQTLYRNAAFAPVSAAERDMLEKFRATPVLETHLTPLGTVAKEVTRNVEAQREARVAFINKRLGQQKTRARDGFNRSQ